MLHMKHSRVVSYRRRIAILAAYDKGCPVNRFTASGRMNLYEGKGFSKAGVCNWLPLYYHAGMYRVPYCYICDKERLGHLRNLGSLSRNKIYQSRGVQCYLGLIVLLSFFPRQRSGAQSKI